MKLNDPVITRVAAKNPVPDPDALTAGQRAAAEQLREWIARTTVSPARRSGRSRLVRHTVITAAAIVPVAVVVLALVGVHHRPSAVPGHGGLRGLRVPGPGDPQTLLLIGSDHRYGTPYRLANTDAIMLVRIDPSLPTINVLSVPRDLKVRLRSAGFTQTVKLNTVYSLGSPRALVHVLRTQVFPGLEVNHIIDFNFAGFSNLVDALGCVYGDIDHRYLNQNTGPGPTDYSSIDLQPGYQRLCGAQALQFVRFRHTDTDLVRNARQQDFLRWLSDGFSAGDLISNRDHLFQIIGRYAQSDHDLHTLDGLIELFDLVVNSAGHPVAQIPFPAIWDCKTVCYVTATPSNETAAYEQFLGVGARGTQRPSQAPSPSAAGNGPASVVPDAAAGRAQATALGNPGLPVYYPAMIAKRSSYCSDSSGNCPAAPNPASGDSNAYPRAYEIEADGHNYPSYRMTLVLNAGEGQYYGVQGTTWSDPPILRHPTRTEVVNGRRLEEYGTGSELSLVAFTTPHGTYWISNTLTNSIPNGELIAIAASMRPAG